MGSDIGKSRAERIREFWPICAHDVSLWVRMRRQIARTRADFPQFSQISDNRETGWWREADSNPRDPLEFGGRNRFRVWRAFRPEKKHPCWREFVHQVFDSFSDLSGSLRSLAIQVCLSPFARDGVRVGLLCGEPGTFEIYQQYTNNRSNQLTVEFLNSECSCSPRFGVHERAKYAVRQMRRAGVPEADKPRDAVGRPICVSNQAQESESNFREIAG